MILRKVIVDGKEVYEPLEKEEAKKLDDYSDLVFTDEDEKDDFFDEIEDEEDEEDNNLFEKVGKFFKKGKNFKDRNIIAMLPFLDKEELHEIAMGIIEGKEEYQDLNLVCVAPFLDDTDCDMIFTYLVQSEDHRLKKQVYGFVPFVSKEFLTCLVDSFLEGKNQNIEMDRLYPFMSNKDLKRLFDYYIKKRKENK